MSYLLLGCSFIMIKAKGRGFTLIELMLVLALIGMLSLISYPLYNEHLIKVRRTAMAAVLMDLAGRLERYYAMNNSYTGATLAKLALHGSHYNDYYRLGLVAQEDLYTLQAVPVGGQVQDVACGTLTIDQSGYKSVTGGADLATC